MTKKNRSQTSDRSRHLILMGANEATTRLAYRWLNHTGLATLTYMLNGDEHALAMPNNELANAASLRIAKMHDEDVFSVDTTCYPKRRQGSQDSKRPTSHFHTIKYPAKAPLSTNVQAAVVRSTSLPTRAWISGGSRPTTSDATAAQELKQETQPPERVRESATLTTPHERLRTPAPATQSYVDRSEQELAILNGLAELNASNARYSGRGAEGAPANDLSGWIEEVEAHQSGSGSASGNCETEELGDLISFEESMPAAPPGTTSHNNNHASEDEFSDDLIDLHSNHSGSARLTRHMRLADDRGDEAGGVRAGEEVAQFGLLDAPLKELHQTMGQKARRKTQVSNAAAQQPRRNVPGLSTVPIPISDNTATPPTLKNDRLLKEMKSAVRSMTENLRMFSGEIGLELKFGRLYLLNVSASDVTTDTSAPKSLLWTRERATAALKQLGSDVLGFQTILSGRSADADLLPQIHEPGEPRWETPVMSVAYRFTCLLNDIAFQVDVDGQSFAPTCRGLEEEIDGAFFHCPEHAWDMKVCATRARMGLPAECMEFSQELVKSLRVS
jgi:hypothetical protein